jgi:hypothetical protein
MASATKLACGLTFTTKMRGFGLVTGCLLKKMESGWVVHFDGEDRKTYSLAKVQTWVTTATECFMNDRVVGEREELEKIGEELEVGRVPQSYSVTVRP